MKKSDLKQLIKPIVKECINEVLLEEGLLSTVVSEVAKGLETTPLLEAKKTEAPRTPFPEEQAMRRQAKESQTQLKEHRRKMMEAIDTDAYNGVNLFEGTEPLHSEAPAQGQADLGSPADAGVDISSIMNKSSAIWRALK